MSRAARPRVALALAGLLALAGGAWDDADELVVQIRFAGRDDVAEVIDFALTGQRKSVRLMAAALTDGRLADALIRAKARGADVRAIVADPKARGSFAAYLVENGVPVAVDGSHPFVRSEFLVIDGHRTFAGPAGLGARSVTAGHSLDIRNALVADRFRDEWDRHAAHAEALGRP